MTPDDQPPLITLPATSVTQLADLLTELDEFLRSGTLIARDLAGFLARHGHTHPGFAACNLIDEVSFTALHLRELAHSSRTTTRPHHIFQTTAQYAQLADAPGEEGQQNS